MKHLQRLLLAAIAVCTLSAGALASDWQKQNGPRRPPKEQKEIPREDKKPPPPPREDRPNRGGDKRGGKP